MDGEFRRRFSDALWARLTSHGQRVRLSPGSIVARRGDPAGLLYVIEVGEVEIIDPRTTPPTVLSAVGTGDPVGDFSFMTGTAVTADVRVVREGVAVRFERGVLDEAFAQDPELDGLFHRALSSTLVGRLGRVTSSAMAGAFSNSQQGLEVSHDSTPVPEDPWFERANEVSERMVVPLRPGTRITLGAHPSCDVQLDDPRVDDVHAELIDVEGEGWRVVAVHDNAVLVDGDWTVSAPLHPGDVLSVGRVRFRRDGDALRELLAPPVFSLHVDGVGRLIGSKRILDDVTFTVLSGEVVAMVGPSGAGKSTLVSVMSGAVDPDVGRVRIGHEALRAVLRRQPATTAEVPQDDIVLPELTVEESLRFADRLRVPGRSRADRDRAVNDLLVHLRLDLIRASRIGDPAARGISGGQRKRVNIGQELLTDDTRVLFLDEPTSGLDPRASLELTRLARQLANEGRVVVLVTHDLDPALLAHVDHLLVMAEGGRLAWFGPCAEACEHFGVSMPSHIFDRLPDRSAQAWAEAYARSPTAAALARRRAGMCPGDSELATKAAPRPSWVHQFRVLGRRFAEVKLRDRTSTSVLVLQPVVVAVVVLLVFPRGTSGLLFLLVLSSYWFGMSASVRELISDQVVWKRERRIGLAPSAWVLSKAVVIGFAVAVQCALLASLAHLGVGLGGLGFSLPAVAATAVLIGWVGMSTGLLVSAAWRRSEAAVGTIVLLLVPQIAFSGLLMPLDQVGTVAWTLSWLTPVRYAFHLAMQAGDTLQYLKLGEWHERPVSGELFLLGLRPAGAGSLGLAWQVLVGLLGAVTVAQLAATIGVMRWSRR